MNDSQRGQLVGRVVGLWRYPVKSMGAEALPAVDVSWHGFAGDRRWAFVRSDAPHSGFPWLTLRERGDMNHYLPRFVEPERPDQSATIVQMPSGIVFDVTDPALAATIDPGAVRAIKHDRGIFDTFPLSLITTQSLASLSNMIGDTLEVQRFRPNILVKTSDDTPYPEDEWVGSVLRIGGLKMRVDKRDGRCAVITIDPMTTERNAAILRAVAQDRQGCLGVYGSTVGPGRIAIDDPVLIESAG